MNPKTASKAGRIYGGLSQEQRKAQRRKQFLEAGLEVFGTIGFRAATVRILCKEAKLTDRYFYESYGSLEKLLMAVYEHCMINLTTSILQSMTTNFANKNASSAIEAGLNTYFKELEEPRIARICMSELEGISTEVSLLYNNYIKGFAKIFVALSKKAFPQWKLDEETRDIIAISLVGAMRQTATNWLNSGYANDRSKVVVSTKMLFTGIVNLIDTRQA